MPLESLDRFVDYFGFAGNARLEIAGGQGKPSIGIASSHRQKVGFDMDTSLVVLFPSTIGKDKAVIEFPRFMTGERGVRRMASRRLEDRKAFNSKVDGQARN